MSTKALGQLYKRLEDIDRLLEAHKALSRIKRLEAASIGQVDFVRALGAVQNALGGSLRGRRWGMEALNRAGIVLLTAHFEGYIEDLFAESAEVIAASVFDTTHYDVDSFITQSTKAFRNPNPQNIRDLFTRLGLSDVLATVQWGAMSNKDVRDRLGNLVNLRHRIAHGEQPSVTRSQLSREVTFVRRLAKNLDRRLYDYILSIVGVQLW